MLLNAKHLAAAAFLLSKAERTFNAAMKKISFLANLSLTQIHDLNEQIQRQSRELSLDDDFSFHEAMDSVQDNTEAQDPEN